MTTEDKIARRNPGSIEPAKGMGNLPRASRTPMCRSGSFPESG